MTWYSYKLILAQVNSLPYDKEAFWIYTKFQGFLAIMQAVKCGIY